MHSPPAGPITSLLLPLKPKRNGGAKIVGSVSLVEATGGSHAAGTEVSLG